jgi:hypothetical protein
MTTMEKALGGGGEPKREIIVWSIKQAMNATTELTLDEVLHGNGPYLEPTDIAEIIFEESEHCPDQMNGYWEMALDTAIRLIEERFLDEHEQEALDDIKRRRMERDFANIILNFDNESQTKEEKPPSDIASDIYTCEIPETAVEYAIATNPQLKCVLEMIDPEEEAQEINEYMTLSNLTDALGAYEMQTHQSTPTDSAEHENRDASMIVFAFVIGKLTKLLESKPSPHTIASITTLLDHSSPTPIARTNARGHFDKYLLLCTNDLSPAERRQFIHRYASTHGRAEALMSQLR